MSWSLKLRRYCRSLLFKLQFGTALTLAAVGVLTFVALYSAVQTRDAALVLVADGIKGSSMAARLDTLLQQHRGLVESMPAQLDRARLSVAKLELLKIRNDLAAAAEQLHRTTTDSVRHLGDDLQRDLPDLSAAGDRVSALSFDFVQDEAAAVAQGPYADIANRMQKHVAEWRAARTLILNQQIDQLASGSSNLVAYVLTCSIVVLLVGCAAVLVVRRLLQRLDALRHAMLRLADRDTTVPIPFLTLPDELGDIARAVQSFKHNAVQLIQQETEISRNALHLEVALDNMVQGLCLYDGDHRLQVFNRRFAEIFCMDPERLRRGLSFREVIQIGIDSGNHPGQSADDILKLRNGALSNSEAAFLLLGPDGSKVVLISHRMMEGGGWVATYEDVTERRAAEEKITFLSRHDALTSLANRVPLNERLAMVVADTARGEEAAVLCLDLDRFKAVNDTLGHPVGDQLLCEVADRIAAALRENDMVARIGGDEFVIIQAGISRPEDAKQLAERVIAVVAQPYVIDGHQIVIGTSVGIALAPADGAFPEKLLRNADLALYRAKNDGRGTFCFFEPDMDARLQNRRVLELDLRGALEKDEFELFYQPLVNVIRGEVSGFEALLRWRHPTRGLVGPGEFVPIIEEIGLMAPIGEWVIRRACHEAARWPEDLRVAVNLSPAQFKNASFTDTVREALDDSQLDPRRLELEITESLLLQNDESTLRILHDLRGLGVRIAMDDFGTGYSSLSYLRSFPFDKVKIDQSFIRDLSNREDSVHIVRAVTALCTALGMTTTAEGVESSDQLSKLALEGCTEAQGFLFSKPRPACDVAEIIAGIRAHARHAAPSPG